MKKCNRAGCDGIVDKNSKWEVECPDCVERGYKMGMYVTAKKMKAIFGDGKHYKIWTEEHAKAIREGEKLWKER